MHRVRVSVREVLDHSRAVLHVQQAVAGLVVEAGQAASAPQEAAREVRVAGREHSRGGPAQEAVAAAAQAPQVLSVRAAQRASRESQSAQSARSLSREKRQA